MSGIDIQAVGVILMLCGVASMAFTFLYVRPRRTTATAEVVDEPVYIVHPDEEPHVHRDPYGQATLPHVHGEGGHRTDRRL